MEYKRIRANIKVAKKALQKVEDGDPICTDTLKELSRAIGEPLDFYDRRPNSGFQQSISGSQKESAIEWLEDFIDDQKVILKDQGKKSK